MERRKFTREFKLEAVRRIREQVSIRERPADAEDRAIPGAL